jgi:hypothetical protein
VALAVALGAGVLTGDVPGWRGTGAIGIAAVLMWPRLGSRLRIGLTVLGAAPLLLPAWLPDRPHEGGALAGMALVVAAALLPWQAQRRWRIGVAATLFGLAALLSVKQGIAGTVLPAAWASIGELLSLAWLVSALALCAPTGRGGGGVLGAAGVVVALQGVWLEHVLRDLPLAEAARLVEARDAWRRWPDLEARALRELGSDPQGALAGSLAIVSGAPGRDAVATALARRWGAELPLAVGWEPRGQLAPEVAVDLAWALESRGQRGRAVSLLRRHPRRDELAWTLSLFAWEGGDRDLAAHAWERGRAPANALPAPGPVFGPLDLSVNGVRTWLIHAEVPLREVLLCGHGEAWEGAPHVALSIAGQDLGAVALGADDQVWAWPVALPPGAYRLVLRYEDDRFGEGGDRNALGLSVRLR